MLSDWRWARRGSSNTLRQEGNIAHFLAQEGFFSVGTFRESFDFSSVNSVAQNDSIIVVDRHSQAPECQSNKDFDVVNSSESTLDIDGTSIVVENEGINYEEMLAVVTEGLSNAELSQLSLEDLSKLIEQQFAESIVSPLSHW